MSRLTEKEKDITNTAPILTHGKFTPDIAKAVYNSSLLQLKENYDKPTKSTEIIIPYIGKVLIKHVKDVDRLDENNVQKKEAELECYFSASDVLKRIIGDISDGKFTSIEKNIHRDIKSNLKKAIRGNK